MKHASGKLATLALVLALIIATLAEPTTPASALETDFAIPSSYADIAGRDAFNQPQEGYASDDHHAVASSDNASVSYFGFGFSIPSGNVIDGIVITVESQASSGSDKSLDVSLSYDNGTSWTATKNTGAMTTSDNTCTLGGPTDNWGYAAWTPAIINSDCFRVRLDVVGTGGNVKIDSVQAKVYRSLSGTTTAVATSASPSAYSDPVTFTATVTRSGVSATPTGTVDFLNGGISIGTGTLSGDNGTATATLATSSLAAGTHTITAVYNGDSSFSGSTSSAVSQIVTKRSITITADAKSKVYGDPDPALTYQITSGSLVGSDNFTGSLSRDMGENAGAYDIQQGTMSLGSNYNLTYVGASLTVTTRPITVTANAQSKVYGDPDPALTYQITSGSLATGDSFSGALARVAGELAGAYDIQQGTLSLGSNYDLTYVGASLSIAARPIVIKPPTPTIDSVGPASGGAGETLDVIIQGSEFTGATNVDFGPDVTVNTFSVDSLNRIAANITIHSNASPGLCDVTVTTPSGEGILTNAFRTTNKSSGDSGSWWFWFPIVLLPILGLLLVFLLLRRRKKVTLWDVMARHGYS